MRKAPYPRRQARGYGATHQPTGGQYSYYIGLPLEMQGGKHGKYQNQGARVPHFVHCRHKEFRPCADSGYSLQGRCEVEEGASMSCKGAQYLSLYKQGHRVTEIAAIFGRSKSCISTGIKRAQRNAVTVRRTPSTVCKHSQSCFECPLKDCAISGLVYVNAMPTDYIFLNDAYF